MSAIRQRITPSLWFNDNAEEAVNFYVYWSKLSQGGDAAAQQCGWLKDRYGLSWQIVPDQMLQLDLATLERAAA